MPTTALHNGISISLIGLGCASGVRQQHVKAALESGYKFLDTAQAYQWGYQEHEVADALLQYLRTNENAEVFVQTKVHPENLGYDATMKVVHQSIDRFKGHLDSVLIHKPRCWEGACSREPEGTWQDSWRALEDLYDQGLIRAIGICDVDKWLLKELLQQRIKPHIIQNWMDPLHQDAEFRELALSHGIQYQAYSSLGTQWVHFRGYKTNPVLTNPTLQSIASNYGVDVAQVVINWATRHGISVLPASKNAVRQQSNLDSPTFFDLTEDEMAMIDALDGDLPAKQHDTSVQVHFENPRNEGGAIDAFWFSDSDSSEVPIGSIAAGSVLTMTSYHGHKFVFRDPSNENVLLSEYTVDTKSKSISEHRHVIPFDEEEL
ncbi:MAG: hypothetical protein SGBAC_004417 [Bacillariaceae sp.]